MGRKTSSTKSGQYMNPADRVRKIARKRELKKNKRQRGLVRQAVLKSKDPEDIIKGIIALDELEFDYNSTPTMSAKVMFDKRIRMKETFFKIMSMHKRENNNDTVNKMRRMLEEYELKRAAMAESYAAAKFSAETDPSEIPLPNATAPPLPTPTVTAAPVPASTDYQVEYKAAAQLKINRANNSILKKLLKYDGPGVPVGLPPSLSDIDSEPDEVPNEVETKDRKVTFAGVEGKGTQDDAAAATKDTAPWPCPRVNAPPHPPVPNSPFMPHFAPAPCPLGMRPPTPFFNPAPHVFTNVANSRVVGPTMPPAHPAEAQPTSAESKGPIISAQPKLRNIHEEVTRFVPTVVRVNKAAKYQSTWSGYSGLVPESTDAVRTNFGSAQAPAHPAVKAPTSSKDEIYEQFMAELDSLL